MATAVLGTWWLSVQAGHTDSTRYVVAARAIDPGHRIEAADLRLTPIALPPSVAAGAFTDLPAVIGLVALGPIGPGSLLHDGGVSPAARTASGREISFAVNTPWAVDGALRTGDRIDVYATAAEGTDDATTLVLTGAVVRHLSRDGGGLGEPTGMTITVAVRNATDLDHAVSRLRSADLTVVRSTGVTPAESTGSGPEPSADRSGPVPRSTTTTTTARSPRSGRTVTTTTPTGAGR